VAAEVVLDVVAAGRRTARVEGSLLCTHFGVSGPAVLDVSRHLLDARHSDPAARLLASFARVPPEELDRELLAARGGGARTLARRMPERLARMLCEQAGVEPGTDVASVPRERRRALVTLATGMELPVTGDRGWSFAEATAGGVPLSEVRLETMESRIVPGLSLAGEILDVDGRIGGFNFQWAWASGHVAGNA
jgi:predicted Rossmann fold flavoprotein